MNLIFSNTLKREASQPALRIRSTIKCRLNDYFLFADLRTILLHDYYYRTVDIV